MSKVLPPLAVVLALIGIWEAGAQSGAIADLLGLRESAGTVLVPAPSEIGQSLWQDRQLLLDNSWITMQEIGIGLAISVFLGVVFAVVMHRSEILRRAFYPLVVASQTVPIIAIAPVLVILLGFGIGPKLVVIALICFFPITVATLDGLRAVDPAGIRMMRTLDADRGTILRRLELPAALPHFLSGAKIAVAIAAIGAVFGEFVSADEGLGHVIRQAQANLLTARVFAAVVVLSLFSLALFGLLSLIERRVAWWNGNS